MSSPWHWRFVTFFIACCAMLLAVVVSAKDLPDPTGRRPGWAVSWAKNGIPKSVRADAYPIFPPPREMKLGKALISLNAQEVMIVTGTSLTDREQRAFEILQSSIGKCRVVQSSDPPPASTGTRILLGQPASNPLLKNWLATHKVKLTPNDPGEQGYVIECGRDQRGWTVALGGSDDTGVLYAAQSFAQLIAKDAKGIRARECHVRDWPGLRIRMIQYRKELSELYPALRTNVVYDPTPDPPLGARDLRRNGVLFTSYEYWTMQGLRTSKPRSEGTSCWSDPEVNRLWTESYVGSVKRGSTILFTHEAHDSGWWWRYLAEVWVRRCDECRAAYPDDDNPATADAKRWNSWLAAVREIDPKVQIIVTLPNYYDDATREFGLPDGLDKLKESLKSETDPHVRAAADRWIAQGRLPSLWKYLDDVGKLTDHGIMFCLETPGLGHGPVAAAYQKHLGHPVVDYTYSADGYTGEAITNNHVFAKACADYGVDGAFFCGSRPLNVAAFSGFAWNPDLPQDPKTVYSKYLPALYRIAFGDSWREMLACSLVNPALWADSWDPEDLDNLLSEGRAALGWLEKARPKTTLASVPLVDSMISETKSACAGWEARRAKLSASLAQTQRISQPAPESRPALCTLGAFDFSSADTGSAGRPIPPIGPGALDSAVEPGKRTVAFTGNLSKGGRLIVQYRKGAPTVRLDGQDVATELASPRDFLRRSFALPPVSGGKHTVELNGPIELDALSVYAGAAPVAGEEPSNRQIDLEGAWRVAHGDGKIGAKFGWEKPGYNDSAWRPVSSYMKSMCWPEVESTDLNFLWRKTITVPKDWAGGKVSLRVGSMNGSGTFFVNGKRVAFYGWSGQGMTDITPHVRFGQPNTVAVCTSGDGTNAFATGISLVRE